MCKQQVVVGDTQVAGDGDGAKNKTSDESKTSDEVVVGDVQDKRPHREQDKRR